MISVEERTELEASAKEIRILILDSIGRLGVGHIGGSLSVVEVLAILYLRHLKVDPENPQDPGRDRFVLSKGHAGPALYSTLAYRGFFPRDWLHTLNRGGTRLPSHPDMNLTPGVDMTTGSLGQGLSVAIGIALGLRLKKQDSRVYALIGDGESNEGQIWEAAMAASQFRLGSLIVFTDYNKMQIDGYMHEIMNIEDINSKWNAFGWFVQRVNGHDFDELDSAILRAKEEITRPSMIIMDTKKGKGAHFAEGRLENHNMAFDIATAQEAIRLLKE